MNIEQLKTTDLHFDHQNPRLAEYGVRPKTPEEEIVSILWETMDVMELVQSIAASGFFSHEPLIAIKEQERYVVIEGNRRLAAVKVLLAPEEARANGWDIPALSEEERHQLEQLPALVIESREEAWRYLGFKHVNGPAKWSSYAKAKYIADVHRQYGISLEDIARQIGDRHKTVQRLYRGLMVIEQAEREKVYDREDRFRTRFAFSHLYTGLDYDGISTFLSLKPESAETENPVPKEKIEELGEFCVWLYGSKKANKPPVVETQNPHLRQLDAVLRHREAIAALRDNQPLEVAFELTRPSADVFEEALLSAKRELQKARAYLTEGDDGSDDLLRIAGTVADLADDVYLEMERKRTSQRRKRKRISEE